MKTFHEWAAAGFAGELIPIIPPGVTLSDNTTIDKDSRGKAPGRKNRSGVWASFDWRNHDVSEADLNRWQRDGASVGLRARNYPGIDIDCQDEEFATLIEKFFLEKLGDAPCRVGRAPKRLLVYSTEEPFKRVRVWFKRPGVDVADLIEVLGDGQQFVVAGPYAKRGEAAGWDYQWPRPLGDLGAIELVSITLDSVNAAIADLIDYLELCGVDPDSIKKEGDGAAAQHRETIQQSDLLAPSLDELERVVGLVPNDNTSFGDRTSYIRFGCAIRAAGAADEDRAREIFVAWAMKWEGNERTLGGNTLEVVESDWVRMKPPFSVGWPFVQEKARGHGGYSDADSDFEDVDMPEPPKSASEKLMESAAAAAEYAPPWRIDKMFEEFVYCMPLKSFVSVDTRMMYDKENFSDRFADLRNNKGKLQPHDRYLRDLKRRRHYEKVTYMPGAEFIHEGAVNLWRPADLIVPPAGSVTTADIEPYLRIANGLFPANGNELDYIFNWQAWVLQNPGVKPNQHPLLIGKQGTGKSMLFEPLKIAQGDHNVSTIGPSDLQEQYNDYLAEKTLIVVEEIMAFGRREIYNKLKAILATPPTHLPISKKYQPKYFIPNIVACVFLSNYEDAMTLDDDDRRYVVFQSKAEARDRSYYQPVWDWMRDGGAAKVTRWLLDRDISKFNARTAAPMTEAKDRLIKLGHSPAEQWLRNEIESQSGIFARGLITWEAIVLDARLRGGHRIADGLSKNMVGRVLNAIGGENLGQKRITEDGERRTVWALRRADLYRHMTEGQLRDRYQKEADHVTGFDEVDLTKKGANQR